MSEGKYVVLETDEIKAAAGDRGKVVHLEEFVDAADDRPGVLREDLLRGERRRQGRLPAAARGAARSGRAGIGRFTFHDREYLVAVRALDDVIALHTLRFHDEVVGGDELDIDRPGTQAVEARGEDGRPADRLAQRDFDPEDYEDTYREAVLDLIKRKAAGKEIDLARRRSPSTATT